MDILTHTEVQQLTDETLNWLHDSARSLQATIAVTRQTVETSRTVIREVDAKLLPPAIDPD